MGQPKSKRSAMLDPRHRAVLLKEKYCQQMEQRQDTGAENAETQAVSRVESAAEWGSRGAAGACAAGTEEKAAGQGKNFDL